MATLRSKTAVFCYYAVILCIFSALLFFLGYVSERPTIHVKLPSRGSKNNPYIVGRFARATIPERGARFDWPNVQVDGVISVSPPENRYSVSVVLHYPCPSPHYIEGNSFRFSVNGTQTLQLFTASPRYIRHCGRVTSFRVIEDAMGPSHISLRKLTEPNYHENVEGLPSPSNAVTFVGWDVRAAAGSTARVDPVRRAVPERRIEIVGASAACGFQNECKAWPGYHLWSGLQDVSKSYTAHMCDQIRGAVCHMECWSARGLVQNFFPRGTTMENKYEVAVASEEAYSGDIVKAIAHNMWDSTFFVPDAVLINLGANDANPSNGHGPEWHASFIERYVQFVERIVQLASREVLVLLMCGPTAEKYCDSVQEVVRRISESGSIVNVRFLHLPLTPEPFRCTWQHPDLEGSALYGKLLADHVKNLTGWQ